MALKKGVVNGVLGFWHSFPVRHVRALARWFGRRCADSLRLLAWSAFVIWWLGLLLIASLRYVILPQIDSYRPEIIAYLENRLGRSLSLDSMTASWQGLQPALRLTHLRLHDTQGDTVLEIPAVSAVISWKSLYSFGLRLDSLTLEQAELKVERLTPNQWRVAGFLVDIARPSDGKALNWLLRQGRIDLLQTQVIWQDLLQGTDSTPESSRQPLLLKDVDFRLQNRQTLHHAGLQATLPPNLGGRIDLRLQFQHAWWRDPATQAGWQGRAYVATEAIDIQGLRQHLALPKEWQRGQGQLRLWLDFARQQGSEAMYARIQGVTLDARLREVQAQLGKHLPALDLDVVGGRLNWQRERDGMRFSTENLWLEGLQGLRLPPLTLQYEERSPWLPRFLGLPRFISPTEKPVAADAKHDGVQRQLTLNQLELGTLRAILARIPLAPTVHQLLQQYAPSGQLKSLRLTAQGPLFAAESAPMSAPLDSAAPTNTQPTEAPAPLSNWRPPAHFQLQAKVEGLLWRGQENPRSTPEHPVIGWPGIQGKAGLQGTLSANEQGGSMTLSAQDGWLELPGVWSDPLVPYQRLSAQLSWRPITTPAWIKALPSQTLAGKLPLGGRVWEVLLQDIDWRNVDFQGKGNGKFIRGPNGEDWLDLNIQGQRFELNRVARYLPLRLPSATRDWVAQALQQGQARQIRARVYGELHDFPFNRLPASHPAQFRMEADVEGGRLQFAPQWPTLEGLAGKLGFNRSSFTAKIQKGQTAGLTLQPVDLSIADMTQSELLAEGALQGPASAMLRYVKESGLRSLLSYVLDDATATQDALLRLKLRLPLAQLEKSKAQGSLVLRGNTVTLDTDIPSFERINGQIDFTEQGFTLRGLSAAGPNQAGFNAQFLGGPMRLEGGLRPVNSASPSASQLQIRAEGGVTPAGIKQYYPLPLLDRLQGSASYSATFSVAQGLPSLRIDSTLQGLRSTLPAPFQKETGTAWPLRVDTQPLAGAAPVTANKRAPALLRDEIRASLSSATGAALLQLKLERSRAGVTPEGRPAPLRFERLALGINTGAEYASSGTAIAVQLPQLNLDEWRPLLTPGTSEHSLLGGPTAGGNDGGSSESLPPLKTITLKAKELEVLNRQFKDVSLDAVQKNQAWETTLDAPGAAGFFVWRDEIGQGRGGRLVGRMSRLSIPKGQLEEFGSSIEQTNADLPALDLVIEEFQINQKSLGRLELLATNQRQPSGRIWQLSRLKLQAAEAQLQGTGAWVTGSQKANGDKDPGQTRLRFSLDSDDWGGLLNRLGFTDAIRRGNGKLQGEIQWRGAPTAFDPGSVSGNLDLQAEKGQFLKADPGAGKLLGVLSLQALPRRLTLDFRDVFSEGFAFDAVTAQAVLDNGIVRTDNFKMKSPVAVVALEGQAHLVKETQQLHVVVVPDTRPGLATLAGVIANPIIGVGAFLGQLLFREPIANAFTYEYSITGSWSEPQVTELKGNARKAAREGLKPATAPTTKPTLPSPSP
ncbi:YhdP family protein [Parvibium lacunae]|uniref:TIGR02099 family protein n=1 Tax=Parvibium lacunae TaxID=1888893 RepID=A0A368L0E0_9BURK|nr:YhdP family protein [Parvibium lacunae]RCS56751.1 TIGR02099 family protein [Parvibium lacunae]